MIHRYLPLLLLIITTVSSQQRPPASVTRRPPASVTQRPPTTVAKRPVSGNMLSMRDLDYEVVKLSYIQTDRALAILKTMSYAVVEFKSVKGEIPGENNFSPTFSNKAADLNSPGALPIIIKLPDT